MNPQQHYLCSQLVELTHKCPGSPAESIVNLEEIWCDGAVLESETPVQKGLDIELRCGTALFSGRIMEVEPHELGWRFQVEFSADTRWNPREFQPEHLLDPSALGWKQ